MPSTKKIALWLSEKKKSKWEEFEQVCSVKGYELVMLDLEKSLYAQGPFCCILHKLTDIIASANEGNSKSTVIMSNIETYISGNPGLVVLDPIGNVRQLLNRYNTYSIINSTDLDKYGVFVPNFCQIAATCSKKIAEQLSISHVKYPFIAKSSLGHGSKKAHEMMIIFNENNLKDLEAPCVTQAFVNHNAVIYKVFIMGNQYSYVERPSLKNFSASTNRSTIFFESSDISKANSRSSLSVLDPEDENIPNYKPDPNIFGQIALTARKAFGMELLGVDVVIENYTGKYAIVDINYWPGYDGFPNVCQSLLTCVIDKLNRSTNDFLKESKMECLNVIPTC